MVDSESDNDKVKREVELENYLTQTNSNVSSQLMACTKQTVRKSDSKGQLPSQSSSGHTLATFSNWQSSRFLDSDSDIEQVASMFRVTLRGSHGSPAQGSSARGTKHPATPSSSDSSASPHKLPCLSSPGRGTSVRGRGASQGTGRSKPVGTVNPQPQSAQRKPGQARFVQHGGSSARGMARSSPQLTLPSFSTKEDDDEEDEHEEDDDDNDDDEDEEVDFPKQGTVPHRRQTIQTEKQLHQPIAAKNLNLIRAPRRGKSGFAEIAKWNRSARQAVYNEMKHSWMAR